MDLAGARDMNSYFLLHGNVFSPEFSMLTYEELLSTMAPSDPQADDYPFMIWIVVGYMNLNKTNLFVCA